MLIIRIAGGLGNQMQQYALYRKLLHVGADKDVRLDISWFNEKSQSDVLAKRKLELFYFKDLPMPVCTDEEKEKLINLNILNKALYKLMPQKDPRFTESKMYHPEVFGLRDKYIEGYFACQKYYDDISGELQDLFVFPKHPDPKLDEKNKELIKEMEERKSVSVHIRRGDYLDPENAALFGNIATDEYYNSAMNYFMEKYPSVHFYIFTNDPDYARQKYSDRDRYSIIDHNTAEQSLLDIELMSHCMGNICANSTFSFWGARLNRRSDKEVVRTFTMRNNQECFPDQMHSYWPGWILIDRDGSVR